MVYIYFSLWYNLIVKIKEGEKMNRKQFELLCFYCWQLNIKTLEQLAKWQAQHNARTNAETLDAMAKAYNGTEWATLHGID